jgi:hypothetical protein
LVFTTRPIQRRDSRASITKRDDYICILLNDRAWSIFSDQINMWFPMSQIKSMTCPISNIPNFPYSFTTICLNWLWQCLLHVPPPPLDRHHHHDDRYMIHLCWRPATLKPPPRLKLIHWHNTETREYF